jgi:hypothetical protein
MNTATLTEKTFPFAQTFATLSEVLTPESREALNIDISYNPQLALDDAKYADLRGEHWQIFTTGETDERGETKVFQIVRCRLDGCFVVTRWTPFHGYLSNEPLSVYLPLNAAGTQCEIFDAVALKRLDGFVIRNDHQSRRAAAKLGFVVGKI